MRIFWKTVSHWFFLCLLVAGLASVFYFHLYDYFSFSVLKKYHQTLLYHVTEHYFFSVMVYILLFTLCVALSVPAAAWLTLIGGFMFGPVAIVYAVVSATLGSAIVFLIVRSSLGDWLASKVTGWFATVEKEFQRNAFSYVLFLRLLPVFPFWVVNITAALLAVSFKDFLLATFLGMIPGKLVYVMLGDRLNIILKTNHSPNLDIILTPAILLPLIGLAILALLPVIYQIHIQGNKNHNA